MISFSRMLVPLTLLFFVFSVLGTGPVVQTADAKAKFGGKSFKSTPYKAPSQKAAPKTTQTQQKSGSSFGKGMAGGLLGAGIGAMLFGGLFGMGGEGMGLLPILLLAGAAFFLFRKFSQQKQASYSQYGAGGGSSGPAHGFPGQTFEQPGFGGGTTVDAPPPTPGSKMAVEAGLNEIKQTDPGFDVDYFMEIASDVFFKIQAGWMRRDIDNFKHLLGDQIAGEYAKHFEEMKERGVINKLESIAVREVAIQQAGSTGKEDFVTVLFTASLLDYTVDENTGDVVEGSMDQPIKFEEEWTWARPVGTENWKLEGIHEPK